MDKRKITLIIIIGVIILGGIIALVIKSFSQPKLTPDQKQYYEDKSTIHTSVNQDGENTNPTQNSTIILKNTDQLYRSLTEEQFQFMRTALGKYLIKNVDSSISTASIANGVVITSGTDLSFNLVTEQPAKNLKVRIHPVDYYTVDIYVNDQKIDTTVYSGEQEN